MNSNAFTSLAHVRILLVPIKAFDSIRLGDIPGDAKGEKARFMPSPLSSGYLHLSFTSHPTSPAQAPLYLFRPSFLSHAVIGEQLENILIDIFPESSTSSPSKVCFVFQSEVSTSGNINEVPSGLVIIPSVMRNKKLYIGTLLADLCSQILGEFGRVVHVLETLDGNECLNAALFPTLPLAIDSHLYLSAPVSSAVHSSQSELNPNAPMSANHVLKHNSSLGPSPGPYPSLYKVYGDFFLLAGRTQDAKIWYQEALNLFKTGSDPVWQGSAIEGLAVISVLDLWAAGQGLQTSLSDAKEPWMELYDQLSLAINLYLKSAFPETTQDYSLLALVYVTAVLRQASLLFSFASMLQPDPTAYLQKIISDNSVVGLERLSAITGITRCQIANTLSLAHGPWLLHLGPHERLVILQSVASIYNCLGFKRKEVYVLREVVSCIMDLVVCGRGEDEQLRRSNLGSVGSIAAPEPAEFKDSETPKLGNVGVRRKENLEGNQSILKLLNYACKVLGVNLESVNPAPTETRGKPSASNSEAESGLQWEGAYASETLRVQFGWPELQVGVIREAVAVAEALPDYLAVARISLSALKTMHSMLTTADQCHLYQTASRALNILKRRGETTPIEWWAGQLVSPLHRLPIERPMSLLNSTLPSENPLTARVTNTFLYNPRESVNVRDKGILVEGEVAELVVTLHNPFVFDLELQSLSLITSGVVFDCGPISSIVIRPNSFYNIPVIGIPKEPGALVIKGCTVQAPNGAPQELLLPVSAESDECGQLRRQSMVRNEGERTKNVLSAVVPPSKSEPRYLECVVVPQQPVLRVRRTSLTHGALMLYDGEKSSIRLTLENLSFDDSTISSAKEALSEGELDIFETHEIEYDLIINPGGKFMLSVTCLGKAGCTGGAVHVLYAHVHRQGKDQTDAIQQTFYARQLTYPLTLDAVDSLFSRSSMPTIGVDDFHKWCLFSIEVRNAYGLPFEVTFTRSQDGIEDETDSSVVPPGCTSRIIIPVRRLRLSDDVISQPIPILTDRQLVITKSHLSKEEEQTRREAFWYREELLKIINARWKETTSNRFGDLSLRQQPMTLHMLNAFKADRVYVDMSFIHHDSESASSVPLQRSLGRYVVPPNTIVNLRVQLTNSGPSRLAMTVTLLPSSEENILFEGVLKDIPAGTVEGGQSKAIEIPLCFLCSGKFEIGAEAHILGARRESQWAGVSRSRVVVGRME
ncbi:transport protein Trs120 or TRAPPC9 TRAPP II complex subunit-domain-containing protein [Pisolithus thermaeus]|nr:transport protein Trs120 or TRAPPC9 TRAPP II complex subunit-domain-containing protein [Pisolithus thermaeus]